MADGGLTIANHSQSLDLIHQSFTLLYHPDQKPSFMNNFTSIAELHHPASHHINFYASVNATLITGAEMC
jgi:hypothetical protein